ncbi:hypothetical protein ACFL0M_15620, partial [Thermodesulfobacteriota bacterium]
AAGDFVVKLREQRVDVKLITVRQYQSMFKNTAGLENATLIAEALLVFFLNLSVRMRLDRLDGIGPVVWSGQEAVDGIVKGFFKGLTLKPPIPVFTEPIAVYFKVYLQAISETDFLGMLIDIVATYHPKSPDSAVIKPHLERHAADLYRAIRRV